MSKDIISQLQTFISADKFADDIWESRGLNPSDKQISDRLQGFFNKLANDLIEGINSGHDPERLKFTLKNGLLDLDGDDLDTEEREFVCDYAVQLSQIVNISINDILMEWMYGPEIANLANKKPQDNSSDIVSQPCVNCSETLKTKIVARQADVPDFAYHIIRCNKCKAYNVLNLGPGILEYNLENSSAVEIMPKNKFSKEQVIQRLMDLSSGS